MKLEAASLCPLERATEHVGILKSSRSTTIHPQIEGQITQILVKSGDRIRQGDPLL